MSKRPPRRPQRSYPDAERVILECELEEKVLRISLPRRTYGLDVLTFIGWQHEHEHKQFAEIQEKLNRRRIEVSERHVGRLYRQFLALLGGMNASVKNKLDETAKEHGGLIVFG